MTALLPLQAKAGDYCTDLPACSGSKVLVLVDDDKREDCARFRCVSSSLAAQIGTPVTAEMLKAYQRDPRPECGDGRTAVKLKQPDAKAENAWQCVATAFLNTYRDKGLLDETAADRSKPDLVCEGEKHLVRYKTKPKNRESAWDCVSRMAYLALKNAGKLAED